MSMVLPMEALGEGPRALEGALARWEDDGGSVAVRGTDSIGEEVLVQVRRWWDAWANGRLDTIASMTTDEYSEITEMREWRRIGKAALQQAARRFFDSSTILRWDVQDPVVHTFENREAFAVCTYRFTLMGNIGGGESEYEGFATDVLVKENDGWKYFSHHNSFSVPLRSAGDEGPAGDH